MLQDEDEGVLSERRNNALYLDGTAKVTTILVGDGGNLTEAGLQKEAVRVREWDLGLRQAHRVQPVTDIINLRRREQQARLAIGESTCGGMRRKSDCDAT